MGIFSLSGSTKRTSDFLNRMSSPGDLYSDLDRLAQQGVIALQSATPFDSGQTAMSWDYEIEITPSRVSIHWTNSHREGGAPVAVLLQYGHGTGTGGYVQGRDYINPAIRPIFDQIAETVWKKVSSA